MRNTFSQPMGSTSVGFNSLAIARVFNISPSEILKIEPEEVIGSSKILLDTRDYTIWWTPIDIPRNSQIISFNNGELLHTYGKSVCDYGYSPRNWIIGLEITSSNQYLVHENKLYFFVGKLKHLIKEDSPEKDGGIF